MTKNVYVYAVTAALVAGLVFASTVVLLPRLAPGATQTMSVTNTSPAGHSTSGPKFSAVTVGILGAGDDAQFNPQVIKVEVGVNNTVFWSNESTAPHTVTSTNLTASGAPLFDSGDMGIGNEFSYTFVEPGTYPYFCVYHGTMVGRVMVEAQAAG